MRRVAVIGLNNRAERLILAGFRAATNCSLVAVVSRSADKAASVAAKFSIPATFTSVEDLVSSGVADTVFINTPSHHHVTPGVLAARAGLAVVCEKPLADDAVTASELVRAVQDAKVPTAVHFTMRGLAGPRMVARLLRQGAVGRLLSMDIAMLQPKELLTPAQNQSSLVELAPHVLDLATWWGNLDVAPQVLAATAVSWGPNTPDLALHGFLRTAAGASIMVQTNRVASGFENGVRALICGENGSIDLDLGAKHVTIRVAKPSGPFVDVPIDDDLIVAFADFPRLQMEALVDSINGSGQFPTIAEAFALQEQQDRLATLAGFAPRALARFGRPA